MTAPQIVIIGAGGHAISVAETAAATGYQISAFAVHAPKESSLLGSPVVTIDSCLSKASSASYVVAIGDNYTRERVMNEVTSSIPDHFFPVLIHPSASVSQFAQVGPGSVVLQGAIVGSHANLGRGCLVNSGAVVEHECELGDFSSVAPNATLGGRVRLGIRSAVSIVAVIKHGLVIGDDSIIGAASYVHQDQPSGIVAFGSPAVLRGTRQASDAYLH